MGNDVEIRFQVVDDTKVTPSAAPPAKGFAPPPSAQAAQLSQFEKDSDALKAKQSEVADRFSRFESRLEYRMKRMGARMIGGMAVQEIGGYLGAGDSMVGRLGGAAIEGAIMGGEVGAAVRVAMQLVKELIEKVRAMQEQDAKDREIARKQEDEAFKNRLDFEADLRKAKEEIDDHVYELTRKATEQFNDYMMNASRYINVPYLGGRG